MSRLILLAVIAASGGDRYYASEEYCTRAADTPAHTLFAGRLVDSIYERAVSFPVWDRAGGGQAISYVELVNVDGALDSWLAEDWKDVQITLKIVEQRAAYSTAIQVGVCIVDRLEAPSTSRVRFVCRSVFERLEKTITQTYSNSVTNESQAGKPRPITLGRVRWLDPVNKTLNDSAGSTRAVYEVADDYFEKITELRERGGLEDESTYPLVTNTTPTYFVIQEDAGYGFRFREQTGRLAAEVRGQVRLDANLVTNESFSSGLTGWTATTAGASTITPSGGMASMSGANDTCTLEQDITTVAGQLYQIAANIDNTTNTGVDIIADGVVLRWVQGITSRTVHAYFTATGTTTTIGLDIPSGRTSTCDVTSIECKLATRIDSLSEIIRFAAVTRCGLSTGDLDTTALADIDTATGYAVGWHSNGGEARGIDLANLAAQSFGVAIFQDANGLLSPVQIDEPAVSADFEIDELSIIDITWEADTAPGLSTRMYYGRNYAPHSDDDVGALTPTISAIALLIAELKREVLTVTTTETLDAMYADAEDREPLESILSEQADAQAEIDRLCALYTVPRAFYTIKAFVETGTAHTIEPGATVTVTHSRYGLSAGVNLLVVAARSDFLGNAVDLVLWG